MSDYIDTNGDGVPDAFENRPSITEILNAPSGSLPCDADTVIIEVETVPRSPKKGELYLCAGEIQKAFIDYSRYGDFKPLVIRRIIAGNPKIVRG